MQEINLPVSDLLDQETVLTGISPEAAIHSICVDSRKVKKGDWFLCLRGGNFDGHDFIQMAIESGAAGIIFDRGDVQCSGIKTADTTRFLGHAGAIWRKRVNPVVIAVTGSNGKTSVKELISFLLEKCFPGEKICRSSGNFNNQFGVPYTLLSLRPGDKFLVLEIGTNHPGEIAPLSVFGSPDFALITSVSQGHIGNFGSLESIVDEKSDIVSGMHPGGVLIVNSDLAKQPLILKKAERYGVRIQSPAGEIAMLRQDENGTEFIFDGETFQYPVCGHHQFQNLGLALSLMRELLRNKNITNSTFSGEQLSENTILKRILRQLGEYRPVKGRLQKVKHALYHLWDDTYNANPASFSEAVVFLSQVAGSAQIFGAFGMMGELGSFSENAHENLGLLAAQSGFTAVFFSSPEDNIRQAFLRGWMKGQKKSPVPSPGSSAKPESEIFTTGNSDEDILAGYKFLCSKIKSGDHLLVKGSRSTRMERIFPCFLQS